MNWRRLVSVWPSLFALALSVWGIVLVVADLRELDADVSRYPSLTSQLPQLPVGAAVLVEGTLSEPIPPMGGMPTPLRIGYSQRLVSAKRSDWRSDGFRDLQLVLKLSGAEYVQVHWKNAGFVRGARKVSDPNSYRHRWVGFAEGDPVQCRAKVSHFNPLTVDAFGLECEGGTREDWADRTKARAITFGILALVAAAMGLVGIAELRHG